jgi:predicted nucleic acid-binding Zn ribbon protein
MVLRKRLVKMVTIFKVSWYVEDARAYGLKSKSASENDGKQTLLAETGSIA